MIQRGYRTLAGLGLVLLVLTYGALSLHVPGAGTVGTPERKAVFVAFLGLSGLVCFAAIGCVRRGVPPGAVWLIAAVGALARIGPLMAPPFLSSDVYRYAWDGRVQAAGINPYLFVPAAPELAALRDEAVYPRINRAETAPTIYPPMAQALLAAIGWAAAGVTSVKAMMVGFETLLLAAAAAVLRRSGLPRAMIVVWAWNPLAIWAFAGNGHVDAAAAGLLALALLAVEGRAAVLSGLVFGAAVLTKFLPLVAAPVLWPAGRWRAAAGAILAILALYGCYAGAGVRVLGFLGGYGGEEGLEDGSGIWLLAGLSLLAPLPPVAGKIYLALGAVVLSGLGAWIAFVWRPMAGPILWRAAGVLMAGVTVIVSPHYPWYFAWLALPAIVAPSRTLIWLGTAPVLLYVNPFGDRFLWASVVYLPACAAAVLDWRNPLSVKTGDTA